MGAATAAGTRTRRLLPPSPPRPMGASAEAAQAASRTVSIRGTSARGRFADAACSFSAAASFLFVPFLVRIATASSANACARSNSGCRKGPNCASSASQSCFNRLPSTRLSEATNSSTNNRTFTSGGSTTSGCATMNASKAAASKPTSHLSLRGSQAGCFSPGLPGAPPPFSFSQSAVSFPLYPAISCFRLSWRPSDHLAWTRHFKTPFSCSLLRFSSLAKHSWTQRFSVLLTSLSRSFSPSIFFRRSSSIAPAPCCAKGVKSCLLSVAETARGTCSATAGPPDTTVEAPPPRDRPPRPLPAPAMLKPSPPLRLWPEPERLGTSVGN
mmetsp:Transcript_105644/g.315547  ORF Transcript_105644/g.315547 Transcript_105644/m.315547 type:complete len:327 (-) Transcript_105644:51-1031(-)